MGLIVTQEHIDAAREAGACEDELEKISVGMPVANLSGFQLEWAERTLPRAMIHDVEARAGVPLWGLSWSGGGYGRYGDEYGHGICGDGFGARGYAYKVGAGHGYGDGYGYGEVDGEGEGYGDGGYY